MQTPSRLFVASLCVLALGGAGCSFFQSVTEPTTPAVPSTPTAPAAQNPTDGPFVLPVIDGTWQPYTNRALGFSLKFPTKGRLAPTWEVLLLKPDDAKIVNGCYQDSHTRVIDAMYKVGESWFCHSGGIEPGMNQQYWTDYYLTEIGKTKVVVAFQKHTSNGDVYEDERCHGKYIIENGGETCTGFVASEYMAHLDQIMGTFVLGE